MTLVHVRYANPGDALLVAKLIRELAAYEKLEHEAKPNSEALQEHLHEQANPRLFCLLATTATGVAGFALLYRVYTSFLTNWAFKLEDIYIRPEFRGKHVGTALMREAAKLTLRYGGARLDLEVLDWNSGAKRLYLRLGGTELPDWLKIRYEGPELEALTSVA